MEMSMINQGRTAEIFDLGDRRILKLFRQGIPQPAIEDECRVAAVLNEYDLPIPEYFGRTEKVGRTGLIYEYIDGVSMIKCIMDQPWTLVSYAKKMAEAHAAIHRIKANGIPRRKDQMEYFITHTDLLTDDLKRSVLNELNGLPDGHSLCHGDLHPDNILFSDGKPVVIDWMTAASGDPACDVARTYILLKLGTIPKYLPLITRVMATVLKSVLCAIYLRHYMKITGIVRFEIRRWELSVAAARLFENVSPEENDAMLRFISKKFEQR